MKINFHIPIPVLQPKKDNKVAFIEQQSYFNYIACFKYKTCKISLYLPFFHLKGHFKRPIILGSLCHFNHPLLSSAWLSLTRRQAYRTVISRLSDAIEVITGSSLLQHKLEVILHSLNPFIWRKKSRIFSVQCVFQFLQTDKWLPSENSILCGKTIYVKTNLILLTALFF